VSRRLDDAERRFGQAQRLTRKFWTPNIQPNPAGGSPAADPSITLGRFGSRSLWCARMPTSYLAGWYLSLTGLGRWALFPADDTGQWLTLAVIAFTVIQGVLWSRACRVAVRLSEDESAEVPAQRDTAWPEVRPDPALLSGEEARHYRDN